MILNPVVIVDYGIGNVGSIRNMVAKIGGSAELSDDPEVIEHAQHIILPGVGSFDAGVSALRQRGLDTAIRNAAFNNNHLLGVCLGMQLLLDYSEEGSLPGLGLIPGFSKRFPNSLGGHQLTVPHMGWNTAKHGQPIDVLPSIGEQGSKYYFVHSFYAKPDSESTILATTSYGLDFASSIALGRVLGVQFHPEKSHRHGMRVLSDFLGVERTQF